MTTPTHYQLAMSDLGLREVPGHQHNPQIVQMFRDVGHSEVDNDETSWCAASTGSWLERSGIPSTRALNARSYLDWGTEVGNKHDLSSCRKGDVVVLWREHPKSWKGHVALYVKHTATHVWLLGGNQKNAVRMEPFPVDRVLSVRRANAVGPIRRPGRKFTTDLVRRIAPRGAESVVEPMADLLNEMLPRYDIVGPKRVALFLANVFVETGGLSSLEENLSYSAKRITQVWPSRFPSEARAKPYAHYPSGLANAVYGGRGGNQGHNGWGWKYRGRGLMMTTFRDNYERLEAATGLPVTSNPDLLLEPRHALLAACEYWKQTGCNELADVGKIRECRRRINGGTHGLSSVAGYYKRLLPLVRDLDLRNVTTRVTTTGVGFGAAGGFSLEGWLMIGALVLILAAVAGFIIYRKRRNHEDVETATREAERLENEADQPGDDPSDRTALGPTGSTGVVDGD